MGYRFSVWCLSVWVTSILWIGVVAASKVYSQDSKTTGDNAPESEVASSSEISWQADPADVARQQRRAGVNATESKVPTYKLPNLWDRELAGDSRLANADWQRQRAMYLERFREHIYGRRPKTKAMVTFKPGPSEVLFDGKVVAQSVKVRVAPPEFSKRDFFEFPFVLYLPDAAASAPVPLVVHINNRRFVSIKTAKEDPDGFCPVEMICQNGVALATFHTSQVDPDRADGYDAGIRGFLANGKPRGVSDWGALSAWGWGASQILDFTEDHPGIDHDHVAVIGHSRGGKAALWAAAEDERFSTAYSNNSGCGGAALFRRRYGETTAIITRNFPHWFCKKLNDYAGNEDALPVDQHQLIAAIAPRRVYVTSASQDLWADPKGEYLSLVHAAQVFTRLGHRAVNDPNMPPVNRPVTSGQTGYHIRQGKHNLTPQDWKYFLDFFLDVDR